MPSKYFHEMVSATKDMLYGKNGKALCFMFWIFLPILPPTILVWYLADMLNQLFDKNWR